MEDMLACGEPEMNVLPVANPEEQVLIKIQNDPTNIPLSEALQIVRAIAHKTGSETVLIDESEGRILSEPIYASSDLPGFNRATMDGFALLASDTIHASGQNPCILKYVGLVAKGIPDGKQIISGQALAIQTGGVVPEGADTIIPREDCTYIGKSVIIPRSIEPGMHISRNDEDFKKNKQIYPEGWMIRTQDIPILASLGKIRIKVRKKPIIGIISTGKELVPSESIPKPGEVREVNSHLIATFCRRQGAVPMKYGIVRDDPKELASLLKEVSDECDAIMISGGSNRDHNDITAQVVRSLGKVYTEGISFAPDKRTTIGKIGTVLVIGLPGHPPATFMVLTLVVVHLLQAMKGAPCQRFYRKEARLTDHLCSNPQSDRYIRVRLTGDAATPVFGKSGLIQMLYQSDGMVRIPAGHQGYREGEWIEVMTW